MSLPKLQLETTIPSYLTARPSRDLRLAANQEATQEWWECQRYEYDLYVSAAVLSEAGEGGPVLAARRLAVLDGIPELRVSDEVTALAAWFLSEQIIPAVAEVVSAGQQQAGFSLHFSCTKPAGEAQHLELKIEQWTGEAAFVPVGV